ncbi:MAG: ATP-binding protein [Streptosporangiaceae bacterium]
MADRTRASTIRPWISRLGLRLALVFVAVALAAVAAVVFFGSLTTTRDINKLLVQQHSDLATAVAAATKVAHTKRGWDSTDLNAATDLARRAGAEVQVTDRAGRVIEATPGYLPYGPGSRLIRQVVVHGRMVGWVTVTFDKSGLSAAVMRFRSSRWPVRYTSAGVAVLIALIAALLVSPRITAPVERLIVAARARGRGELGARAGQVHGFGEIRELAAAFDQMADVREEQDRIRRNLVADVAHELRTPIAILQAGHEAMLDGVAPPTEEHLASLRDEVLRLARMVDDLQRLAAAEAAALQLTLAPHDLAEIAASAADSLADTYAAAAGVTMERRLSGVVARCDPLRMHEIATNLLTNALKFTPGGTVTLQTGREHQDGLEVAVLRVTDSGVGIPPAELPRLAERFFRGQLSSDVAGSGIGLTIVAELVRAHHGTIEFASEPGHGTEVTVRVPVTAGPARPAGPATPAARSGWPANLAAGPN